MAWMFRFLQHIIASLPFSRDPEAGWVEPSNLITRAVLSPAAIELPEVVFEPVRLAEIVTLPARPQPATRTAKRTRRRRATRAA